ncbi:hypothetical protein [Natronoglomus mannanivorans]|uniref:Uncharacterized protein n=1 Tax=Natronoglomus mannanivorans TaxID=2979990 RepID=A0AAP3E3V3_9EURY|nr:hypothetical protein [Halobacteria archaeon AArc-xg1-1]
MSTNRVDERVEANGVPVELEHLTDFAIDANGQVTDEETDVRQIKAVISSPSESDTRRLEGRLSNGSVKLTVKSDVDVRGDRDGASDKIRYPVEADNTDSELYRVVEVRDDTNHLTGTRKKTVLCDRLGGR